MRGINIIKWGFLFWVCLEIAGFVWVAEWIGLGWTILLILASMVIGAALLRQEGFRTANLMMSKMRAGQKPSPEDVAQTPFVMFGAILLIIPGFFSDIVGILCFLPPVRFYVMRLLSRKAAAQNKQQQAGQQHIHEGRTFDGDYHRED